MNYMLRIILLIYAFIINITHQEIGKSKFIQYNIK